MRCRRDHPQCIINLTSIPAIDYVTSDEEWVRIGAMASLRKVESTDIIPRHFVALYEGITSIASVQVRATGTLIGNLCIGTPASDIAPPLIALGATVKTVATDAPARTLCVDQFYTGPRKTILHPAELVTDVVIPIPSEHSGSAFLKLVRTASDISKVCVAVFLDCDGERLKEARVVLGAVAPTPIRASEAEVLLQDEPLTDNRIQKAADAAAHATSAISDIRSLASYRSEMVKVLVARALEKAWKRAQGEPAL
jgi:carbon-monoxide dehydrogenase medium subunit